MSALSLITYLNIQRCRQLYEVRSKPNCIYCFRAMALLLVHGLSYVKRQYDSDQDKQTMREAGYKSWPMIYKDGKYIGGYSELLMKLEGSERF